MRVNGDAGALRATTLNLSETERRALLSRAAELTVAAGRPISISEVAREAIRKAAQEWRPAA